MKLKRKNFKVQLQKATVKDVIRPAFNYVMFDKGFAVATNAHISVKSNLSLHGFTPEESDMLSGYGIASDAFKTVYGFEQVYVEMENGAPVFRCLKGGLTDAVTVKLEKVGSFGKFPNYEPVIPGEQLRTAVEVLGLDLRYVSIAGDLLCGDNKQAALYFHGDTRAVLLRSTSLTFDDEVILIMPVMLKR
jgi:hypothetical protein